MSSSTPSPDQHLTAMGIPAINKPDRADLAIFRLPSCQPQEYEQAREVQIVQADPSKIVQGWLPEMVHQYDKYSFWTRMQDEQETNFKAHLEETFGHPTPRDRSAFSTWLKNKLAELPTTLSLAHDLTDRAKELAFICLTNAKERNQHLKDYPFAFPDLNSRQLHERYAEDIKEKSQY